MEDIGLLLALTDEQLRNRLHEAARGDLFARDPSTSGWALRHVFDYARYHRLDDMRTALLVANAMQLLAEHMGQLVLRRAAVTPFPFTLEKADQKTDQTQGNEGELRGGSVDAQR